MTAWHTESRLEPPARTLTVAGPLIAAALVLAGCSGGGNGYTAASAGLASTAGQPLALTRPGAAPVANSVRMAVPQGVDRAIDRYQINRGKTQGPVQKAGVDLDGDGEAEALVLFTGEDWCAKTGCTLVVMRRGARGFRAVSTVQRVKPPVVVAATPTNGWRDLFVRTGGGGMRIQTARLRFSGSGYPGNASIQPPFLGDARANGETVFAAAPAPALAVTQSAGRWPSVQPAPSRATAPRRQPRGSF